MPADDDIIVAGQGVVRRKQPHRFLEAASRTVAFDGAGTFSRIALSLCAQRLARYGEAESRAPVSVIGLRNRLQKKTLPGPFAAPAHTIEFCSAPESL